MNIKNLKIQKFICIFFILLCCFMNLTSVQGASYEPQNNITVPGSRTPVYENGIHMGYATVTYYLTRTGYSSINNTASYNVTSKYYLEDTTILYGDALWINGTHVGNFNSNNGSYSGDQTVWRTESIPITLHSGNNTFETTNIGGVGGESETEVLIISFTTPPIVIGTNGVWKENDVSRGIRTWESVYTDGATGSSQGNKTQTSTGFMYKDVDEQPTPINPYSNSVLGNNSRITEIKNANTGATLPVNINTLNNAGTYWIKSCTKDSGNLEGCGTRYITVLRNDPPVITGTDKTFYQGQYTSSYWLNTLRWNGMNATDTEDGNLTSKVKITYDNVDVNVQGNYKVVYNVTDSGGKTITKEINVNVLYNNPPVITGKDKTFYQGQYTSKYWLDTLRWEDMGATDIEDGNLTAKVKITYDNVNVNVASVYKIIYSVTDSFGKTATKEIKVTVKFNNTPVITGVDKTFYQGQYSSSYWLNTLRWKEMSATDVEDGNLTSKVKITYDNVDVNVPGVYKLVYSVSDSFGKSTSKEIKITVKFNNPPTISAEDRWFYVEEDVTNTKLMERVKANDIEDGNLSSKATIKSSNVQSGVLGIYKVTYIVKDAYGKSAQISATIHIVSNTVKEGDEIKYLRFINSTYIQTLKEKSIWKSGEYQSLLQNSIVKKSDEEAIETWHLTAQDIEAMKAFNATNDFSKQSAQAFYEQFQYAIK